MTPNRSFRAPWVWALGSAALVASWLWAPNPPSTPDARPPRTMPAASQESPAPSRRPVADLPSHAPSKTSPVAATAGSRSLEIHRLSQDEVLKRRDGVVGFNSARYGATLSERSVDVAPPFAIRGLGRPRLAWSFQEAAVDGIVLARAAAVTPVVDPVRREVVYARGAIVEKYLLRPDGLEQVFVIPALPSRGALTVSGRLETNLDAPEVSGRKIAFTHRGAEVLSISEPWAIDAAGRRLPLELALADGRLSMTLPAAWVEKAALPITIDPLIGGSTTIDSSLSDVVTDVHGRAVRATDAAHSAATNEYLAVWAEPFGASGFNFDVLGQRLSARGRPSGPLLLIGGSAMSDAEPTVCWASGVDRYLVAWRQDPDDNGWDGDARIRGRVLASDGTFVSDEFTVDDRPGQDFGPSAAFDGVRWYVCWTQVVDAAEWNARGRFVSTAGAAENAADPDAEPGLAGRPTAAFVDGRYLVAWEREPAGGLPEIVARTMDAAGAFTSTSVAVSQAGRAARHADVTAGPGTALIVWEEAALDGSWDVVGRIADPAPAFRGAAFGIAARFSDQVTPRGGYSPANDEWVVVYTDPVGGSEDVFATRVSGAGDVQAAERVTRRSRADLRPEVAVNTVDNEAMVVYVEQDPRRPSLKGQRLSLGNGAPPTPGAPVGDPSPNNTGAHVVSWAPSSGSRLTYALERSADGGASFALAATPRDPSFTETGLPEGAYIYRVRARSSDGVYSAYSDESAPVVVDRTAPPAPAGLGQFRSDGATALPPGGVTPEGAVVLRATPTDASTRVRLEVEVKPAGADFDGTGLLASAFVASGEAASVLASPLAEGAYRWRARAADEAGNAGPFVEFGGAPDFVVGTAEPPLPPSGLTATPGNGQVSLAWTASAGADGYAVKRGTAPGGPYTELATVAATAYTDLAAANGTTFYYVVTARNAAGESGPSIEASATPQAPPAAPSNLVAAPGDNQVALSWDASVGADSYAVKRSTTPGGPYEPLAEGIVGTSYTDRTALNGTTYHYVASARNVGGESPDSAPASATPLAPPAPPALAAAPGDGQVTLTWTASAGATAYSVYRAGVSGGPYGLVASDLTGTTFVDGGLANGTPYFYVVTATNAGGESAYSNEASAVPEGPAVAAPVITTASGATNDATPTIEGTSDPDVAISVVFSQGGTTVETLSTTASALGAWSVTASPKADGAYVVVARASIGSSTSGDSNAIAITVDTIPPAVALVTSSTPDGTYGAGAAINLTVGFTESVVLSGGSLQATLDTGAAVQIDPFGPSTSASGVYTVAAGESSPDLTALGPLTLTGGTLRDAAGNEAVLAIPVGQNLGDHKNIVISTLALPPPPSGLTATGQVGAVALQWTAPAGAVNGYSVYRSEDPEAAPDHFALVATSVGGTSHTDASLGANGLYRYYVTASNGAGESGPSNIASAATLLEPPSSVALAPLNWHRVQVGVAPPPHAGEGDTGLAVERSQDGGASWQGVQGFQPLYDLEDLGRPQLTTILYRAAFRNRTGVPTAWAGPFATATPGMPEPVIRLPFQGEVLSAPDVLVSGTAPQEPLTVTVLADNVPAGTGIAPGDGQWTAIAAGLSEGTHLISARLTDDYGNVSPDASPVQVIVDLTPPSIEPVSPEPGSTTPPNPLVSATWIDTTTAVEPSTATLSFDHSGPVGGFTADFVGISYAATDLPAGLRTVTVTVRDTAGHLAARSWSFTVGTPPDTTAPSLALAPADGAMQVDATPTLTATYTDDGSGVDVGSFRAFLGGVDVTGSFTVGASSATWTPAPTEDGTYVFRVQLSDVDGNAAEAQSTFRIVSATGPIGADGGTLEVVEPGKVLLGAAITLPAGALAGEATFVISRVALPGGLPPEVEAVGPAGRFEPANLAFGAPAGVRVPYLEPLPGGASESDVRLYGYDSDAGTWSEATGATVDALANRVEGQVTDLGADIFVAVIPRQPAATTTIAAMPATLPADGITMSVLTVVPKNASGEPLGPGLDVVLEVVSGDGLLGPLIDQGDGRYVGTAFSTAPGDLVVRALVDGTASGDPATLTFYAPETMPSTLEITGVSSPLAAGTPSGITLTARDSRGFEMKLFRGGVRIALTGTQDAQGADVFASELLASFTALDQGVLSLPGALRFAQAGEQEVSASLVDVPGVTALLGGIEVTPAAPARLVKASGDGQRVLPGEVLPLPFVARVLDTYGNPVPGVPVAFDVIEGGGSFAGAASSAAVSDAAGEASSGAFTVGPVLETDRVRGSALALDPLIFEALATRAAPVVTSPAPGSDVTGPRFTVTGSDVEPGHTVRVLVGGVVVGSAVADAEGNWSVEVEVAPGVVTFVVEAVDESGLVSIAAPPTTVDLSDVAGPELAARATPGTPSSGGEIFTKEPAPVLRLDYADISGVDEAGLFASLNGLDISADLVKNGAYATYAVPSAAPLLESGNTLAVTVRDLLGNATVAEFQVRLDLAPPGIRITPKQGEATALLAPAIRIDYKDPATVLEGAPVEQPASGVDPASLRVWIDDEERTSEMTGAGPDSAILMIDPLRPLFRGERRIEVTLTDRAGNVARRLNTFRVDPDLPPDAGHPNVFIRYLPPSPQPYLRPLPILVEATDSGGIQRVELLANDVVVDTRFEPPYAFTYILPSSGSSVTLKARGYDFDGNLDEDSRSMGMHTPTSELAGFDLRIRDDSGAGLFTDRVAAGQPLTVVVSAVRTDGSIISDFAGAELEFDTTDSASDIWRGPRRTLAGGVQDFSLPPLVKAGYHALSVRAVDPVWGFLLEQFGALIVKVDAAEPVSLNIVPAPGNLYTAGNLLEFTVDAKDGYGNVLPDFVFRLRSFETDEAGVETVHEYNPMSGSPAKTKIRATRRGSGLRVQVSASGRGAVPAKEFRTNLNPPVAVNVTLMSPVVMAGQPVSFSVVVTDLNGVILTDFTGTVWVLYDQDGDGTYEKLAVDFDLQDRGVKIVNSGVVLEREGLSALSGTTVNPTSPGFGQGHYNGGSDDLTVLSAAATDWQLSGFDPQYVEDDWSLSLYLYDAFGNQVPEAPVQIVIEAPGKANDDGTPGTPRSVLDVTGVADRTGGFELGFGRRIRIEPSVLDDPEGGSPKDEVDVTVKALQPIRGAEPELKAQMTVKIKKQRFKDPYGIAIADPLKDVAVGPEWELPSATITIDGQELALEDGNMTQPIRIAIQLKGGGQYEDLEFAKQWFGFTTPDVVTDHGRGRFSGVDNEGRSFNWVAHLLVESEFRNSDRRTVHLTITNATPVMVEVRPGAFEPVTSTSAVMSAKDEGTPTGGGDTATGVVVLPEISVPKSPELFEALTDSRIYLVQLGDNDHAEAAFLEGTWSPRRVLFRDAEEFMRAYQLTTEKYNQNFFVEIRTRKEFMKPEGETRPAITGVTAQAGTMTDTSFTPAAGDDAVITNFTCREVMKNVYRSRILSVVERPLEPAVSARPRRPGLTLQVQSPIMADNTHIGRAIAAFTDMDNRPVAGKLVTFAVVGENSAKVKLVDPNNPENEGFKEATTSWAGTAVVALKSDTAGNFAVRASCEGQVMEVPILFYDQRDVIRAEFGGVLQVTVSKQQPPDDGNPDTPLPDPEDAFTNAEDDNFTKQVRHTGTHGVHIAVGSLGIATGAVMEAPAVFNGPYRRIAGAAGLPEEAIATPVLRYIYSDVRQFGVDYDGDTVFEPEEIHIPEIDISDGLPDSAGPARNRVRPDIFHFRLNNPGSDTGPDFFKDTKEDEFGNQLRAQGNTLDWRLNTTKFLNITDTADFLRVPAFFPGPNKIRVVFRDYYEFSEPVTWSSRVLAYAPETPFVGTQFESWDQGAVDPVGDPAYLDRYELFFPLTWTEDLISDFLRRHRLGPMAADFRTGRVTVYSLDHNLTSADFHALQAQLDADGSVVARYLPGQLELFRTNLAGTPRLPSVQEAPRGTTPFGGGAGTVNLHNGEFVLVQEDLRIPGIGMDWHHTRTYRSQISYDGPQGQSWDFNYNIRIGEHWPKDVVKSPSTGQTMIYNPPDGSPRHGDVVLFDGTGRRDVYVFDPALNAYYAPPGRYDVLTKRPSGAPLSDPAYTIVDRHQTRFQFKVPADGKKSPEIDLNAGTNILANRGSFHSFAYISEIVDRNGNRMRFLYNDPVRNPSPYNRLTAVFDTTNREIAYRYNPDGTLDEIEAYVGLGPARNGNRSIRFSYVDASGGTGTERDLIAAKSPEVTTPGNEFPFGKRTTYSYTTTGAASSLHNLLTVTDPSGNQASLDLDGARAFIRNTYGVATESLASFDRVTQQSYGRTDQSSSDAEFNDTQGTFSFFYDPGQTIVRDRKGQEETWTFQGDVLNEDSTSLTTALAATPVEHARTVTGIGTLTTTFAHNADTEMLTVKFPRGNLTEYEFQADNRSKSGDGRSRGNLLKEIRRTGGIPSAVADLTTEFAYDAQFNFVTSVRRPRGGSAASNRPAAYTTTFEIDPANGNVTEIKEGTIVLGADAGGKSFDTEIRTTVTYWSNGLVKDRVHPDGSVDQLTYTGEGYLQQSVRDLNGWYLLTVFETDLVGNVTATTDPRGVKTVFEVNELNQVTKVTRATTATLDGQPAIPGQVTITRYDFNDNVSEIEQFNDIPSIAARLGGLQRYQPNFVLPDGSSSNGAAAPVFRTRYRYDGLNNVIFETRSADGASEVVTGHRYDKNENRIRTNLPAGAGNYIETKHNELDLPTELLRSGVMKAEFRYDANGNRTQSIDGNMRITHFEYDGFDRNVEVRDPAGSRAILRYDAHGNLRQTLVFGRDGHGGSDGLLKNTVLFYDNADRLYGTAEGVFDAQAPVQSANQSQLGGAADDFQPVMPARPAVTVRTLDSMGRAVAIANDNDHSVVQGYDTAGRLRLITDPAGNFAILEVDDAGNVTTITQKEGLEVFVTDQVYDALNRLVQTTDPGGHVRKFEYDSRDNLVSSVDGARNRTNFYTDHLGRRIRTQVLMTATGFGAGDAIAPDDAMEINTYAQWDANGNLLAQYDALGVRTRHEYDGADRRTKTLYGDNVAEAKLKSEESYSAFDGNGQPTAFTDRRGVTFTLGYDELGRVELIATSVLFVESTRRRVMRWDALGRLAYAEDNNGGLPQSSELFYNGLGQVIRDVQTVQLLPAGSTTPTVVQRTTETSWDGAGNKVRSVYPSGRIIAREYRPDEQLRQVTASNFAGGLDLLAEYEYAGPGRLKERTYGGKIRQVFAYDGDKQLTATSYTRLTDMKTLLSIETPTRDEEHRIRVQKVRNHATPALATNCNASYDETYSYDSAGRLWDTKRDHTHTGLSCGHVGIQESGTEFDRAGNAELTRSIVYGQDASGASTFTLNEQDRRVNALHEYESVALTRTNAQGLLLESQDIAFAWDKGGNLESNGDLEFRYDAFGRPVRVLMKRYVGRLENLESGFVELSPSAGRLLEPRRNLEPGLFSGWTLRVWVRDGAVPAPRDYPITANTDWQIDVSLGQNSYLPFDAANGKVWSPYYVLVPPEPQSIDIARYYYDGLGRRTVKEVMNRGASNGTFQYAYEGFQIVEEHVGSVRNEYAWGRGIDEPLRIDSFSGTASRFSSSFLEGPSGQVFVARDDGRIEREEVYEQSMDGVVTIRDAGTNEPLPLKTGENGIIWQGHYFDIETGLFWARARYYSPQLGRFIQIDPMGAFANLGGNPYSFSGNDLINGRDPSGALAANVVGAIIGAVVGGVVGYLQTGDWRGVLVGAASGAIGGFTFGLATAAGFSVGGALFVSGAVEGILAASGNVALGLSRAEGGVDSAAEVGMSGLLGGLLSPLAHLGGGLLARGLRRFASHLDELLRFSAAEVAGTGLRIPMRATREVAEAELGGTAKLGVRGLTAETRHVRTGTRANTIHSKTGVQYDAKGFPVFDSLFNVKLPSRLRGPRIGDETQMRYATRTLRAAIQRDPGLEKLFTKTQLREIKAGLPRITGYTWHHYQDKVTLQLVDWFKHSRTGHIGGRGLSGGRP